MPRTADAVPPISPPPPTGAISVSKSDRLGEQLQRRGPLSRDHVAIIKGMHDMGWLARDQPRKRSLARSEPGAQKTTCAPAALIAATFERDEPSGHHHRTGEPQRAGGKCERIAMIAR